MGGIGACAYGNVMASPKPAPFQALVATDLSPHSLPHVAYGARLIERLGGRTTLFHAAVQQPVAVGESLAGVMASPDVDEAALQARLREVASVLVVNHPVKAEVAVTQSAREAILAAARRHDVALLALPTHGRSGLGRALLGSVAEDVVRHAHLPTLLLTDAMIQRPQAGEGRVVLVACEPEGDVGALGPAADLARRLRLPLLLMTVLPAKEPPPYGGGAPVAPTKTSSQQRVHEALRRLRQLGVALGGDLRVEVYVCIDDDPAKAIVARADEGDTALVVLGTHARTGLARAFRGSVAEAVARKAVAPVVVVPAAG